MKSPSNYPPGVTGREPQITGEGRRRKPRKMVVRVVMHRHDHECVHNTDMTDSVSSLLESLRYAQLVTIHRDDEDGVCFDLHCPHGLNDKVWAGANAARMQSFGYNAVAAPATE